MLPLRYLPKHNLVSILTKVETGSWFRLRRTGKFINEFVEENVDSLPLRRMDMDLVINWEVGDSEEKELIISTDVNVENVIRRPELALKGLLFRQITLTSDFDDLEEEKPKMFSEVAALCENVHLNCDVLCFGNWSEYLPLFHSHISFKAIDIESYDAPNDMIQLAEDQRFKKISSLSAGGWGFSPALIVLMKRFDFLQLSDQTQDYAGLRANISGFFQAVRLGEISGNLPKWLRYKYNLRRGEDIEDCEELRGLEKKDLWKGKKRFFDEVEGEDEPNCLIFLLESAATTATAVYFVAHRYNSPKKVSIYVDIRKKEKAEEEREFILERIFDDFWENRKNFLALKREEEERFQAGFAR